jgi:hypothetical protein
MAINGVHQRREVMGEETAALKLHLRRREMVAGMGAVATCSWRGRRRLRVVGSERGWMGRRKKRWALAA